MINDLLTFSRLPSLLYYFSVYLSCFSITDSDLSLESVWHFVLVPVQSFYVILVSIEKVNFTGSLLYPWMEIEHFEQCSCATFPNADY